MYGNLPRSVAAPPAWQSTPGPWRDLKRDWLRWSKSERIAIECFLGLVLAGGLVLLSVFPFR